MSIGLVHVVENIHTINIHTTLALRKVPVKAVAEILCAIHCGTGHQKEYKGHRRINDYRLVNYGIYPLGYAEYFLNRNQAGKDARL